MVDVAGQKKLSGCEQNILKKTRNEIRGEYGADLIWRPLCRPVVADEGARAGGRYSTLFSLLDRLERLPTHIRGFDRTLQHTDCVVPILVVTPFFGFGSALKFVAVGFLLEAFVGVGFLFCSSVFKGNPRGILRRNEKPFHASETSTKDEESDRDAQWRLLCGDRCETTVKWFAR